MRFGGTVCSHKTYLWCFNTILDNDPQFAMFFTWFETSSFESGRQAPLKIPFPPHMWMKLTIGDEHDKFMDINFFDGHGPDFMRPRHSPIRRWFWVSTPSICWFQLYLGMGLSWLVWTWVTLNSNAFSLFFSSKLPLVDNLIFWQAHSPVGIPFPPHLLSRQSRWGRQDVGRLCSGAIHHRGSLPSPMKNRHFFTDIFCPSPCQVDTTPQQMTSRFQWVSGTRAARQDKLHQEFYNVPTKEVDLAGWDQFSIGILGISGWPGWLRIIWIGKFGVSP